MGLSLMNNRLPSFIKKNHVNVVDVFYVFFAQRK